WLTPPLLLARRCIAVRRDAVLMVTDGERPHPRCFHWRRSGLEDAADHFALGEHVVVLVLPGAGGTPELAALEKKLCHSRSSVSASGIAESNLIDHFLDDVFLAVAFQPIPPGEYFPQKPGKRLCFVVAQSGIPQRTDGR